MANKQSRTLSKMGKGAIKISTRQIDPPSGPMLIVEILVDYSRCYGSKCDKFHVRGSNADA